MAEPDAIVKKLIEIDEYTSRLNILDKYINSIYEKVAALAVRIHTMEDRFGLVEDRSDELLGLVGQVVRIKSNPSVPMTAAAVGEDGRIVCVWMDGDGYMETSIPFAALEVVEQEGDQAVRKHEDTVWAVPIDDLDLLSYRACNRLKSVGIFFVGDLVQRNEMDLLKIPRFSRKSLSETIEALAARGLNLGTQLTDADIEALEAAKGGAK